MIRRRKKKARYRRQHQITQAHIRRVLNPTMIRMMRADIMRLMYLDWLSETMFNADTFKELNNSL